MTIFQPMLFFRFWKRYLDPISITFIQPANWLTDWLTIDWHFDLSRVWKRAFQNTQHMKIIKWMKVNEYEWKREDKVEIPEEWNTTRLVKHLRPPRRGLFLRCWSLLQASCLLSASLCFRLRLAPRAIYWLRIQVPDVQTWTVVLITPQSSGGLPTSPILQRTPKTSRKEKSVRKQNVPEDKSRGRSCLNLNCLHKLSKFELSKLWKLRPPLT